MANLKKLIGLNIDTNQVKEYPVKDGTEQRVFDELKSKYDLSLIRRINGSNTFTAYTYHLSYTGLGETLEAFLND